jgi:hypothetical protein
LGLLFAAWWSGGSCWVLDGGGERKKSLNKIIKILF